MATTSAGRGERAKLAIVGGGPKAAALAARVAALAAWQTRGNAVGGTDPKMLRPAPELRVFERAADVGAHWGGTSGYTDGDQLLCTPPDRDVTFPAARGDFGAALDLSLFTWSNYCAETGNSPTAPPAHKLLAAYVSWVLARAKAAAGSLIEVHTSADVERLSLVGKKWTVGLRGGAREPGFDGVVVTSPGGRIANRLHVDPAIQSHVFDAVSYWSSGVAGITEGSRVAVIGGGGAAAGICGHLLARDIHVVMVAPQPTLYTRGESSFETGLLTSDEIWFRLPRDQREEVREKLVSGVVFKRVLEALEQSSTKPEFLVARALAAIPHATNPVRLWCLSVDERVCVVDADFVVEATGFDATWFLALLEEPAPTILRRIPATVLMERVDHHLRLHIEVELLMQDTEDPLVPLVPGLHVPMLAGGSQHPGNASLLALGAMADRILGPYLR